MTTNNSLDSNLVTVADRIVPLEGKLKAWLASGEAIKPLRFGRRSLVLAHKGAQVVIAAVPINKSSDQWVEWYQKYPSCLPQIWKVSEHGELARLDESIGAPVIKEAGEQLSASWQVCGIKISNEEVEEAPIVMLAEASEPLNSEADIIIEPAVANIVASEPIPKPSQQLTEALGQPAKQEMEQVVQAAQNIKFSRTETPDFKWEVYPVIGNIEILNTPGGIEAAAEVGAIGLLVKAPKDGAPAGESQSEASAWIVESTEWREDPTLFMSIAFKPEKIKSLGETARKIITETRERRVKEFRDKATQGAVLRSEVSRTGQLPQGMIGQGNICYASLFTWEGESELEVKVISSDSQNNISQVVAVNYGEHNVLYAPVEAAYALRLQLGAEKGEGEAIELAMSLFGDGSVRMLDEKQFKKIEKSGQTVKIVKISIAQSAPKVSQEAKDKAEESQATSARFIATSEPEAMSPSTDEPPNWPEEENYDYESMGSMSSMEENGPPEEYERFADEDMAPEPAPIKSKGGRKSSKASAETEVGPGRSVFQGAISISSWSRIVPRGWLWATELVLAGVDDPKELETLGGETEIQLLHKGFPFSKSDKQTIDALLKGPLKSRIEYVRIYAVGANDYFVRALADGFRIIGPKGKAIGGELAKKLQEAYKQDPAVLSTSNSLGTETEGRGRAR